MSQGGRAEDAGVTSGGLDAAPKRAPSARYEVPRGWMTRGFEFEVCWPADPVAAARIRSHFGARRKAYNWALSQVKADLDARKTNPDHVSVAWNLYALRKEWNRVKDEVAPWWAENSKEAYATGIADLCAALGNWKDSRSGKRQAAHSLTTDLAATYREVVIEDLDLAAMKQGLGRRAFRRSVSDAALGAIRPQLVYKLGWRGSQLTVADRWFASSKIHHGCGCRLAEPRKLSRLLVCCVTGELVDRDTNAALNLRDWPDHASCSTVGAAAPLASASSDGRDTGSPGAAGERLRPGPRVPAALAEARTRKGTPRRGAA